MVRRTWKSRGKELHESCDTQGKRGALEFLVGSSVIVASLQELKGAHCPYACI